MHDIVMLRPKLTCSDVTKLPGLPQSLALLRVADDAGVWVSAADV